MLLQKSQIIYFVNSMFILSPIRPLSFEIYLYHKPNIYHWKLSQNVAVIQEENDSQDEDQHLETVLRYPQLPQTEENIGVGELCPNTEWVILSFISTVYYIT